MADDPTTKAELLDRIHQGWDEFHAFLAGYSRDQLATVTDAVGWTSKDHIVHLAVWEAGIASLLAGESRREGMGVDEATWASGDYDAINAALREPYRSLTLEEALDLLRHHHTQLMARIEALSDEDLQRPHRDYQPGSDDERPVIGWIVGNTYAHYEEHQPWIAAILDEA